MDEPEVSADIDVSIETAVIDVDGDGIVDVIEQTTTTAYDVDGDGEPDLIETTTITGADVDGDGVIDEDEIEVEETIAVREDLLEELEAAD